MSFGNTVDCVDCGRTMSPGAERSCECGEALCDDCGKLCEDCSLLYCKNCLDRGLCAGCRRDQLGDEKSEFEAELVQVHKDADEQADKIGQAITAINDELKDLE